MFNFSIINKFKHIKIQTNKFQKNIRGKSKIPTKEPKNLNKKKTMSFGGTAPNTGNKHRASTYSMSTFNGVRSSKIYQVSEKEGASVAKRMFDTYDRDRSGFLDQDQIALLIKDAYRGIYADYHPSSDDIASFVAIHDKNGDGMVTLEDWEKTVSKYLCLDEGDLRHSVLTTSPSRTASKKF